MDANTVIRERRSTILEFPENAVGVGEKNAKV
jgi:hypothetical protein